MDQVLVSSLGSNFVGHQLPQAIRSAISLTRPHKHVLPAELPNGKSARRIAEVPKDRHGTHTQGFLMNSLVSQEMDRKVQTLSNRFLENDRRCMRSVLTLVFCWRIIQTAPLTSKARNCLIDQVALFEKRLNSSFWLCAWRLSLRSSLSSLRQAPFRIGHPNWFPSLRIS